MSARLTRATAVWIFAIALTASPALADPIPDGSHDFGFDIPVWSESEEPPIHHCEPVPGMGCSVCVDLVDFSDSINPKGQFAFFFRVEVSGCTLHGTLTGDGKGKIKGKNGSAKLSMSMKLAGSISGIPAKATAKCIEEISPNGFLEGMCKGKVSAKGAGSAPFVEYFAGWLDPDDFSVDGTLHLVMIDPKKIGGDLSLDVDGMQLDYEVKGKYNAKKDESKLAMKPDSDQTKGTKVQVKGVTYDPGTGEVCGEISFKIMGQQAKYDFCGQL